MSWFISEFKVWHIWLQNRCSLHHSKLHRLKEKIYGEKNYLTSFREANCPQYLQSTRNYSLSCHIILVQIRQFSEEPIIIHSCLHSELSKVIPLREKTLFPSLLSLLCNSFGKNMLSCNKILDTVCCCCYCCC